MTRSLALFALVALLATLGCSSPTTLYPNGPDVETLPFDTLDFSTVYNRPAAWDLEQVRGGLVLVENALWDEWRQWGAYPDLSHFAEEAAAQGVTVITLASPAPAEEIEARISRLGIEHPVIVDRGFRTGYHFLTPNGGIEGASLDRLAARAAELRR